MSRTDPNFERVRAAWLTAAAGATRMDVWERQGLKAEIRDAETWDALLDLCGSYRTGLGADWAGAIVNRCLPSEL